MRGHITFGEPDARRGARHGRQDGTDIRLKLAITADDVERFVVAPAHRATVRGYIHCEALGGRLGVERGDFQLFIDDGDPTRKEMRYRLWFRDGGERPLTLSGTKYVRNDRGFDLWRDTTTLFTHIYHGHVERDEEARADLVASGIVNVHPADFARQLTTFRADAPAWKARAAVLARFGTFFAGSLWDVYARRILATSPV
jgi:cholesterol oxidase